MKPVFATPDFPIRASNLPYLFQCTKMFVDRTENGGDVNDVAANTGSMVHAGIEGYHVAKRNMNAGMKAIDVAKLHYPAGDTEEAKILLRKYVERDKSDTRGTVVETEFQGKIEIPCAPYDKTGQAIYITGTIDQIRKVGDEFWVVDHKSGRRYGTDMTGYYAPQLAAYMLIGAERVKSRNVKGFITRLQDLKRSDLPFWWPLKWTFDNCMKILAPVQTRIAEIRNGYLVSTQGKHCEYCTLNPYPDCCTGEHHPETPVAKRNTTVPLQTIDELFKRKSTNG